MLSLNGRLMKGGVGVRKVLGTRVRFIFHRREVLQCALPNWLRNFPRTVKKAGVSGIH